MSGPRMNMSQMNGNSRRPTNLNRMLPPINNKSTCAQHEDLIRYIHDSWNQVSQEVDKNTGNTAIYYHEQEHQNLKDFEPFDLEAYWGRRVVHFQQAQHS